MGICDNCNAKDRASKFKRYTREELVNHYFYCIDTLLECGSVLNSDIDLSSKIKTFPIMRVQLNDIESIENMLQIEEV